MAHFQFEGDINVLSPRQLEYISSILEKRGYTNEKVLVQAVGKAGDNYVANVKRIVVEKDGETFTMIAKIAPTVDAHRAMMNTGIVFLNEHVMYTEVLPKLAELQISADVPTNERLRSAVCYGSLSEPPNEVILLEDLQVSHFVMLDRFNFLSDESVKIVLKNFAILHSLSYVLKKLEPETYAALKAKLVNAWELMDQFEEAKLYAEQLESDILSILDGKYKTLFKGAIVQLMVNSRKMSKIDKTSKYSVIQQGDAWTNNIMFKMEGDKPVDCCMIDYQLSKEGSPVADIHYMIFNCTDHGTRVKHYNDWMDYYHTELDKSLSNFGLKANYVFPKDQLDADLRRYGKLSFGLSSMLASVMIRESSDAAKFKDAVEKQDMEEVINSGKISNYKGKTRQLLIDRLEGLVNSFLEFGYM